MSIVHIGYPKSASTTLQLILARTPGLQILNWANYAGHIVSKGAKKAYDHEIDFKLTDPVVPSSEKTVVVSCEELSAWSPGPVTSDQLARYQKFVAESLKEDFGDAVVLIILRKPSELIRSYYNQLVKEGLPLSLKSFLCKWRGFLNQLIDFANLARIYGEIFGNERIVVLPFELLLEDADEFFRIIRNSTGIEIYGEPSLPRSNRSLNESELELVVLLNRLLRIVSRSASDVPREFSLEAISRHNRNIISYYLENNNNENGAYKALLHIMSSTRATDRGELLIADALGHKRTFDYSILRDFGLPARYVNQYNVDIGIHQY
jgi:hypothetical protein